MPSTFEDLIDGISTSTAIKAPCRVVTSANITLSGLQTIDGVALAAGDRVLVKEQTAAADNGIWVAASSTWQRAKDWDGNRDVVQGTRVPVTSGTGAGEYHVTTANPITIGTTSVAFAVGSGGRYATGDGTLAAPAYAFTSATGTGMHRETSTGDLVFGVAGTEGLRIDSEGRIVSSSGTTAAVRPTRGATQDPLQVPFVGANPMDAKIALSEYWINNDGGTPFLTNQISSYVVGQGNVWAVPVLGTGIAASSNTYAWGLAGVAAAYDPDSHAFGAELNCISGASPGGTTGDYTDTWCLSMAAVGGVSGAYPTGYMYMVSPGTAGAPQNMIVLRDEGSNPVKTTGNILVTGYTAGFSGSAHLTAANGINLLNTSFSGYPFVFGTSSTPLFYVNNSGQLQATQLSVSSATAIITGTSTTGTNRAYAQLVNSGGSLFCGLESSAGGALFSGTSAYDGVLGTTGGTNLRFATNNTLRGAFTSAGAFALAAGTTSAPQINLASGVAPSAPAAGDLWSDGETVKGRFGGLTRALAGAITSQHTGDTNNSSSGSGSDYTHNKTETIPASYLTEGKAMRVTAMFKLTTGAAAPSLIQKLKLGSTVVADHAATTPQNNIAGHTYDLTWTVMATSAPGASGTVNATLSSSANAGVADTIRNTVSQPVTLATNGDLVLSVATRWGAAGTGTNTIQLIGLVAVAIN
jgi:hypothetical protein